MKFNEFYKLYLSGDLRINCITEIKTNVYYCYEPSIQSLTVYLVDFTYGFRYYHNKLGIYKRPKIHYNTEIELPKWFFKFIKINLKN